VVIVNAPTCAGGVTSTVVEVVDARAVDARAVDAGEVDAFARAVCADAQPAARASANASAAPRRTCLIPVDLAPVAPRPDEWDSILARPAHVAVDTAATRDPQRVGAQISGDAGLDPPTSGQASRRRHG
jgi:hypothetical protein